MTLRQIRRAMTVAALVPLGSVCLLLGAGHLAAAGPDAPPPNRKLSAVAHIRFQGTSTLHDFEGTVMSQPFVLVLSSNSWSAEAHVLGSEMTTAHDGRDKNMKKMLETNQHPRLTGAVRDAAIPTATTTKVNCTLRVRDRSFELPITISDWSETAEALRFQATWKLSLQQFKLKPPSVLGVIRVGDEVRLVAQVTARKPAPATVPAGADVPAISLP
ncbi:MAG: YceI family protein [Verrucomicrobia bacterium]|nr:YceI family protein [Verrucomicrobiota bacterium]